MVKSKTKISKQLERKRNPIIIETIIAAKKNKGWLGVADILSKPRSKYNNINLSVLNEKMDGKNALIIVGKILSDGEVKKKGKVVCLSVSSRAKEKLLSAGVEVVTIIDEIKKNPEGKNMEILK